VTTQIFAVRSRKSEVDELETELQGIQGSIVLRVDGCKQWLLIPVLLDYVLENQHAIENE